MMMPSIFGENLFDDWFSSRFMDDLKNPVFGKREKNLMKTDIKDKEDSYHLDMDLPGFKKEDIQLELREGYLTVSAAKGLDKKEEDENGNFIRQERYTGQCSRSFFVGRELKAEDMKASFQDGILHLEFPKKASKEVEEQHRILIE